MRRMILIVMLLALCFVAGCAPQPDLTGRWQTDPEETLCATILSLNSDGSFWHMQEGQQLDGTWTLQADTLTLRATQSNAFTCTLDRKNGQLITSVGLRLSRQPDPDISGYWLTGSDASPLWHSLFLMPSGQFKQEIYPDGLQPDMLDGGQYLTGNWSLGGLVLTLRGNDKTVLTYRLSPDCTTIDPGNGIPLTKHPIQQHACLRSGGGFLSPQRIHHSLFCPLVGSFGAPD